MNGSHGESGKSNKCPSIPPRFWGFAGHMFALEDVVENRPGFPKTCPENRPENRPENPNNSSNSLSHSLPSGGGLDDPPLHAPLCADSFDYLWNTYGLHYSKNIGEVRRLLRQCI